LKGNTRDETLKNLIRQREGLRSAVSQQENEIQFLTSRIAREVFKGEDLRVWYVSNVIQPKIDLYEAIVEALKQIEVNNQYFRIAAFLKICARAALLQTHILVFCFSVEIWAICKVTSIGSEKPGNLKTIKNRYSENENVYEII